MRIVSQRTGTAVHRIQRVHHQRTQRSAKNVETLLQSISSTTRTWLTHSAKWQPSSHRKASSWPCVRKTFAFPAEAHGLPESEEIENAVMDGAVVKECKIGQHRGGRSCHWRKPKPEEHFSQPRASQWRESIHKRSRMKLKSETEESQINQEGPLKHIHIQVEPQIKQRNCAGTNFSTLFLLFRCFQHSHPSATFTMPSFSITFLSQSGSDTDERRLWEEEEELEPRRPRFVERRHTERTRNGKQFETEPSVETKSTNKSPGNSLIWKWMEE